MKLEEMCRAVLKMIHEDGNINISKVSEETGIARNSLYIAYKSELGSPLREYTQRKYIDALLPYLFRYPDKIFFILMEYYPVYVVDNEPDRTQYASPVIRNVMDWFMVAIATCYKTYKPNELKRGERCLIFVKSTNQVWIVF